MPTTTCISNDVALQDIEGAKKEVEFLVDNALLHEVDGSFYVHDLLLDFIKLKCTSKGMRRLVEDSVLRQTQYLGRLSVVLEFYVSESLSTNRYALIRLWRSLEELSGNKQLEVETYRASLGEFGRAESREVTDVHHLIGSLFYLHVSYWYICHAHSDRE